MNLDLTPFWVSFQLGIWVTGLLLVLTFPLAWILSQAKGRWAHFVEPVLSLPLVVSPTVLGFYFLVFFSPNGTIGAFLENTFGIRLSFSFAGMVIASTLSGIPFMYTALRSGITAIPINLLEASYTLGKGRLETLFRVVIPLMRNSFISGAVTTFAHTLGEFGVVLMIGGSIPGVTKTVSIAIYEKVESLDFASAQIYSLVMIVIGYLSLFLIGRLRPPKVQNL